MTVKEMIEFLQTCPEDAKVMFWHAMYDCPYPASLGDEVRYNDAEQRVEIW